jgi:hypothetical protein
MDDEKKKYLEEFFKKCYERLEMGEGKDGNRFESLDLFEEMGNELVDLSNYAYLQYIKPNHQQEESNDL